MIIIDYSAISIANIAIQKLEPNEDIFRSMILNSIRMYRKKYGAEYGEIVIAVDAGGNWRKEYYPEYKAKRQTTRKESPLDWNAIFKILNQVLEEIKESFPYTVIGQEGMEADDIIAQLVYKTQEFGEHEPVMIISGDKDFAQLQKFSNVSQWSPITKKLIKEPEPINKLKEHIFRGDTSDGVPNILSCDDVFLQEGVRQTPLTKKKIELFINAKDMKDVMTEDEYRNYIRNKKMIDLEECPEHFKDIVYIEYDKQKLSQPKNKSKVMPYFIKHRCKNLLTNIQEFI